MSAGRSLSTEERRGLRVLLDRAARAKKKGGGGRLGKGDQLLPESKGNWIPVIRKVNYQHTFSAMRSEFGGVPD